MANLKKKSNLELIKEVIGDPERKSISRMMYELCILLIMYREIPVHYFSRYIFKKRTANFKDFMPNKLPRKISVQMNDHRIKDVLDNKLFFNFFYGQFDIRLPRILMFNNKNIFVVENETFEVDNEADFNKLITEVFKKEQISRFYDHQENFRQFKREKGFQIVGRSGDK